MRKILITAGASGIGRHIAEAFLADGDAVYTCDIDAHALKAAAADLRGLMTGVCDIGDRGQIEAMVTDDPTALADETARAISSDVVRKAYEARALDVVRASFHAEKALAGLFNRLGLAEPRAVGEPVEERGAALSVT